MALGQRQHAGVLGGGLELGLLGEAGEVARDDGQVEAAGPDALAGGGDGVLVLAAEVNVRQVGQPNLHRSSFGGISTRQTFGS